MKTLTIIGRNITDISSFYIEINRVFMSAESWVLGQSLDALNDMLYGSYGAIEGGEPIEIVWQDADFSREALGVDATRAFLEPKLLQSNVFNEGIVRRQLEDLDREEGKTYFDIVFEIFGDHPNIKLVVD